MERAGLNALDIAEAFGGLVVFRDQAYLHRWFSAPRRVQCGGGEGFEGPLSMWSGVHADALPIFDVLRRRAGMGGPAKGVSRWRWGGQCPHM